MSDLGFLVVSIGMVALCWLVPDLLTAVATVITYAMAISRLLTGILIFMG
jgi:hypothetical protein